MILSSLMLIMLAAQDGPIASAPASVPGLTAEAFRYDYRNEAQRLAELIGEGERTETVGPGRSGDVRSAIVRSDAGVTAVMTPVKRDLRRPQMCRVFIPATYRDALLGQEAEVVAAALAAADWCINRVSPLIVEVPTIRPPSGG